MIIKVTQGVKDFWRNATNTEKRNVAIDGLVLGFTEALYRPKTEDALNRQIWENMSRVIRCITNESQVL